MTRLKWRRTCWLRILELSAVGRETVLLEKIIIALTVTEVLRGIQVKLWECEENLNS
jgi:hypothetical protein